MMYCSVCLPKMLFFAFFISLSLTAFSAPIEEALPQVNQHIPAAAVHSWTDEGSGDDVDAGGKPGRFVRDAREAAAPVPLVLQSSPNDLTDRSKIGRLEPNDVPNVLQCGIRPKETETSRGRIVEGVTVETRWPWMVQILRKEDRELICGGTLLSDRHVITAAHCIRGSGAEYDPDDLIIRIGDHYSDAIEPLERDMDIECLFVHPNYQVATLQNDIAVIKLKINPTSPLEFSSDLLPACLPKEKEFRTGHNCFITGWGYRDFADYFYGLASPSLQEAKVPLIDNRQCQGLGRDYAGITKKMLCAGYLSGTARADTCKKDSGGPLVCQNAEGVWKLWGITSWGDNTFCEGSPDLPSPGVYTRVDKYLSWIDNKLAATCPLTT